jgi:hypothetical protein
MRSIARHVYPLEHLHMLDDLDWVRLGPKERTKQFSLKRKLKGSF